MLRLRVFVVLALVISLAGVGLVYGQQGMKMKLTGQDFAEIEQLYGAVQPGQRLSGRRLGGCRFSLMTECLSSAATSL